ncbi:nitroreductase family protein [Romboutsia sp.]|uniref:nitroreductase family protein n=1 Tax=Romboutsia sp. TaxID=1965302 RepID=UPI003F2E04D2
MELYDAIFYRRTTRKYSNKKVTVELLEEIKRVCNNITYLNQDLNIKAHVVERGHIVHFLQGKNCKVKAPHYLIITSTKGEDYLENIGFAIEEIVLNLTTLGIATCWLESNLKREDILEFVDLDEEVVQDEEVEEELNLEQPCIMVAFGYPGESEQLLRRDKAKIDRKKLRYICKKASRKNIKIINAIRFSPSVKNCQPWVLYNDDDSLHLYEDKQKKNLREMSKISMGIGLRHIDISCKKHAIPVTYEKVKYKKKIGKEYYISIILK